MQLRFPGMGGNRGGNRGVGTQRVPASPKAADTGLRGPFGPEDTFELPDGRAYQPCDAATDDIYGGALANPVQLEDSKKAIAAAGLLGFSVVVPTILIKVIGGY
mmetsp:Transcript_28212/g.56965  ORF Transcript_28212/g.56965 Transcript_28212/m.56965 type:complete len:104 (-) Transcript_28212:337-648(-)